MALKNKKNGHSVAPLVAAIDIGSSKTACLIARLEDGAPRIVGVGHRRMEGVRNGAVINLEAARDALVNTITVAENMAGETIRDVVVNVSCGKPHSEIVSVDVPIGGHEVSRSDVRRLLLHGRKAEENLERELVHAIPVGFRIDDTKGIRDPRGLYGDRLGADIHTVTAEHGPLRTLAACISGCHLQVSSFVVSAYASGLAALVDDERELGATVIDLGAGATGVAVFQGGELVHTDAVPVGGGHVTTDIAHGLSTPLDQAERIKMLYGTALSAPGDEAAIVEVPPIGEADEAAATPVPKSLLTGIVKPRVEETLELVRGRLEASGWLRSAGRRIVLTGGASKLRGLRELTGSIFDCKVRTGRAYPLDGLAESATGPAFAASTGLILYAIRAHQDTITGALSTLASTHEPAQSGVFRRVGSWLHEHF